MSKDFFEEQREQELAVLRQTESHYVFWESNYNPITMHKENEMSLEQEEARIKKLNRNCNI